MTSNNPENSIDSATINTVIKSKSILIETARSFHTSSRSNSAKKTYTVRNDFHEKTLNVDHGINDTLTTSNQNDNYKSNRAGGNKNKKLSFNHDEDDCEFEDDSIGEKAALRPSLITSDSDALMNNIGSVPSKTTLNHEAQTMKTSEGILHLDVSEVRRSESDDPMHDDLDYDEDSITSSPSGSKAMPKRRITSTSLKSGVKETSLSPSSTQSGVDDGVLDSPMSAEESIVDGHNKQAHIRGEKSEDKVDEECNTKIKIEAGQPSDKTKNIRNNRIKSFINLNHLLDEKREACSPDVLDSKNDDDESEKLASRKSYRDLLRYFFKDAIYFQIKSINHENVELSKSMGVWSTSVQNEQRLNSAFHRHQNVILIFSVQQSGAFQGFARMISESVPPTRPVPWVLPKRFLKKSLGGVFKIDWLCSGDLSFNETQHLLNPFNENKPVKIARDGQVLEPRVAKKVCKLFPRDSKRRLISCIRTLKQHKKRISSGSRRDNNMYPLAYRQADHYGGHYQEPRHHLRHHHSFHPYAHPGYLHQPLPHQAYYPQPPMPDFGYPPAHDYVNFLYSQVISHNSGIPYIDPPPGASRGPFPDYPLGPGPIGRGRRMGKYAHGQDSYMYGHLHHPYHSSRPYHSKFTPAVTSNGPSSMPPDLPGDHVGSAQHHHDG